MSVKDDFMGASIFAKIALILLLVATLFICIAFTTTGWASNANGVHWGMWRVCGNADYSTGPCAQLDGWANNWYAGTQAMVTIGFFGILVATALVIFYLFLGKCQKNAEVALAAAIIAIVTGVFLLIGIIVFGAEVNDWIWAYRLGNNPHKLDYDFGLAIVAMIFEIAGGILMILEKVKGGGGGGGVQASA